MSTPISRCSTIIALRYFRLANENKYENRIKIFDENIRPAVSEQLEENELGIKSPRVFLFQLCANNYNLYSTSNISRRTINTLKFETSFS